MEKFANTFAGTLSVSLDYAALSELIERLICGPCKFECKPEYLMEFKMSGICPKNQMTIHEDRG